MLHTTRRQLYPKLPKLYETIKPQPNLHFIHKTRSHSFFPTPLHTLLTQTTINQVQILPLSTHISLLHTPISPYNLPYKISLPPHPLPSFNQKPHQSALPHFKNSLPPHLQQHL
ncbi:isochorismatase family protein [Staphylococcus aureus]|uniref:isochorismatase family protein n=1 Tax=Staphylococcus aureus TaxID=1280 RepID=UPI00119CB0C4